MVHIMLDEDTAYLFIPDEETDAFHDAIGYLSGDHKYAREKYRTILRELRSEGMTKLIIDTRNNSGGFDEVATAIASLFKALKKKSYKMYLALSLVSLAEEIINTAMQQINA